MSDTLQLAVLFLIGALASIVGVRLLTSWALRRNLLDVPNSRSSHTRPTPRGGGLAIAAISVSGWVYLEFASGLPTAAILGCVLGAALVIGISWLDDLVGLSARVRLLVHLVAAGIAVISVGSWDVVALPFGSQLVLGGAGTVLTVLWIVGLTNAYNFMDGSDGMAGTQAVIAGLGWSFVAAASGDTTTSAFAVLLAGSSTGFLVHNMPPARIFMGDVGSAFLGYSFAILPLLSLHSGEPLRRTAPLLGFLFVWPFICDTSFTLLRRLVRGENIFAAHRTHVYQRAMTVGYSHRCVLLIYATLALIGAELAVLWHSQHSLGSWGIAFCLPCLSLAVWRLATRQEDQPSTLAWRAVSRPHRRAA